MYSDFSAIPPLRLPQPSALETLELYVLSFMFVYPSLYEYERYTRTFLFVFAMQLRWLAGWLMTVLSYMRIRMLHAACIFLVRDMLSS